MKPLTLRRAIVPLTVGLFISLLPYQFGFAQTTYEEARDEVMYAEELGSSHFDYEPQYESKLQHDDWRHDWEDRMDEWRNDWDDRYGRHNDGDEAEAKAAIEEAKQAIKEFQKEIYRMKKSGVDKESIDKAKAAVKVAKKDLSKAKKALRYDNYSEAIRISAHIERVLHDWDWEYDEDEDFDVHEACMLSERQLDDIRNFPPGNGPIVAFGDSLTAGVGARSGQDYVSQLEDRIGEDIINAGVSGDTTEEALARLERDVLSHDPRAVIVWLGGNDHLARYYEEIGELAEEDSLFEEILETIFRLFGKEPGANEVLTENQTFSNIQTIVERIQDSGAVVILVGIDGQPLDKNLSRRYKEVAEDTGAIYVKDVLRSIVGRPTYTSRDLVHPNAAGYGRVAERIYPAAACVVEDDY